MNLKTNGMKTTFEKIDDNLTIVKTSPRRKDLAYFNGKVWEYKGLKYDDFKNIPLPVKNN